MQVPMVSFKERAEDGKTLASRLRDEILGSRLLPGPREGQCRGRGEVGFQMTASAACCSLGTGWKVLCWVAASGCHKFNLMYNVSTSRFLRLGKQTGYV